MKKIFNSSSGVNLKDQLDDIKKFDDFETDGQTGGIKFVLSEAKYLDWTELYPWSALFKKVKEMFAISEEILITTEKKLPSFSSGEYSIKNIKSVISTLGAEKTMGNEEQIKIVTIVLINVVWVLEKNNHEFNRLFLIVLKKLKNTMRENFSSFPDEDLHDMCLRKCDRKTIEEKLTGSMDLSPEKFRCELILVDSSEFCEITKTPKQMAPVEKIPAILLCGIVFLWDSSMKLLHLDRDRPKRVKLVNRVQIDFDFDRMLSEQEYVKFLKSLQNVETIHDDILVYVEEYNSITNTKVSSRDFVLSFFKKIFKIHIRPPTELTNIPPRILSTTFVYEFFHPINFFLHGKTPMTLIVHNDELAETFRTVVSGKRKKKKKMGEFRMTFKSHDYLDEFILQCMMAEKNMIVDYPLVSRQLKIFDFVFWFLYECGEKESKYKPLMKSDMNVKKIMCPFGDPFNQ